MVLGVSDHTMAMHQWMLLASALRRRPEYAALLADPRLGPATVAKSRAAVSCAYDGGMRVLADDLQLQWLGGTSQTRQTMVCRLRCRFLSAY